MTIEKNNRMFNLDEREKFKVRKSKKHKNLCSLAIGVLAISGLATGTVSANEVTPAVTEVTATASTESTAETVVSTEVEASTPQPATIPVQTEPTAIGKAILDAQAAGVTVKEEAPVDYGVVTSPEEMAKKQEDIQVDYNKQAEAISETAANHIIAKEKHQEEAAAVINLNHQLKVEYDKKIEAYNAEVSQVNAKNAEIDAAYEQARQAYEAEVAGIDAYNANAKTQYEEAFQRYQVEVQRITQQNAYKKERYHTQLSEFNKQVAIVNEDNKRLEAEYQAAQVAYETELARIQESNANAETAHAQALATYRSEVERINRDNEAKRVAYDAARRTFETNSAAVESENQLIRQRNQQAQAAYERAMAAYNVEKQRHEQAFALARANTNREGYLSKVEVQNLVLRTEPNATIESITGTEFLDASRLKQMPRDSHLSLANTYMAVVVDGYLTQTTSQETYIIDSHGDSWVPVVFEEGKPVTITYENIRNSTWGTENISKIEVEYTLIESGNGIGKGILFIAKDPTLGVNYSGFAGREGGHFSDIKLRMKLFNSDGMELKPSQEQPALLVVSSLNSQGESVYEYVKDYSGEFIPITGSSIQLDRGQLWAPGGNYAKVYGSKYDLHEWDDKDSNQFYYGSGIIKVTDEFSLHFGERSNRTNGHNIWFALSSEAVGIHGIIPTPPKPPTLNLENEKESKEVPPIEPTYETPPTEPTVTYLELPTPPAKPTVKELPKEPEAPLYDELPEAPSVTYKAVPKAPEKAPSVPLPPKPEVPDYQELPKAPETPTVSYRLANLSLQPRVTPTKTNTDGKGLVIDGQKVVAGSVNYYKIGLDYSSYKGLEVDPKLIEQGFFAIDDFPEEALVLETTGFQLTASDNSPVKGLTSTVYASLSEAPQRVQEAMAKQGFAPKGAIVLMSADDPKSFFDTYVKTGMKLTATLPMTVKGDMAKTGGQYENTAYQIDFGTAYVTETVVNNVTPVGRVLVNFIEDGTGTVLAKQVVDELDVLEGTSYDTTDRKISEITTADGKTYGLIRHEGKETGTVVKGDTIVDYIYKEVLGTVEVQYKDKEGRIIKEPVVDAPEGSTGRDYDTTDHKVDDIVTKDGKTYRLVPNLTEGQEKGKVTKGKTIVTYIFEEIKADVVVNYIDENGNVIKKPVKDIEQGSTGTSYDTTDNKPDYITVDGVRYKLMPKKTIGSETGILTKDGVTVTYVYHKIVTNWVEEGTRTPLRDPKDGEHGKELLENNEMTFVVTEVDPETGDITHVFKKVPTQTPPLATPPAKSTPPQLPKTGETSSLAQFILGLGSLSGAVALAGKKRRQDD